MVAARPSSCVIMISKQCPAQGRNPPSLPGLTCEWVGLQRGVASCGAVGGCDMLCVVVTWLTRARRPSPNPARLIRPWRVRLPRCVWGSHPSQVGGLSAPAFLWGPSSSMLLYATTWARAPGLLLQNSAPPGTRDLARPDPTDRRRHGEVCLKEGGGPRLEAPGARAPGPVLVHITGTMMEPSCRSWLHSETRSKCCCLFHCQARRRGSCGAC
jgi:hypothetical protein